MVIVRKCWNRKAWSVAVGVGVGMAVGLAGASYGPPGAGGTRWGEEATVGPGVDVGVGEGVSVVGV
jgi:hypothetical protein